VLDLPYDSAPEAIPVQVASGEVVYQRTGSRDSAGRRIYRPASLLDRLGATRARRPRPPAPDAAPGSARSAAPGSARSAARSAAPGAAPVTVAAAQAPAAEAPPAPVIPAAPAAPAAKAPATAPVTVPARVYGPAFLAPSDGDRPGDRTSGTADPDD
jgi:translation initiation factor IF-2